MGMGGHARKYKYLLINRHIEKEEKERRHEAQHVSFSPLPPTSSDSPPIPNYLNTLNFFFSLTTETEDVLLS